MSPKGEPPYWKGPVKPDPQEIIPWEIGRLAEPLYLKPLVNMPDEFSLFLRDEIIAI